MDRIPQPPEAFFEGTPPHVRAYIELLHTQMASLEQRIAELEAKLAKNTTNSSQPPSTAHPHAKPLRHPPKSPRSSGGQPGHAKHERPLLPTEHCQHVVPCVPAACRRCESVLTGTDSQPFRHQVWELPEIQWHVTEYQRHRLAWPWLRDTRGRNCRHGVPAGQAGPRLMAFAGLLMAYFRQSKRASRALFWNMILQPTLPSRLDGIKIPRRTLAERRPDLR